VSAKAMLFNSLTRVVPLFDDNRYTSSTGQTWWQSTWGSSGDIAG